MNADGGEVGCRNSSKTLSKTLKEWVIGGTGEDGVDVVGDWSPNFVLRAIHGFPSGLCHDRFRNGDRQKRRSVRIPIPYLLGGPVLTGSDTSFTMIFRRVWKVNEIHMEL